MNFVTLCVGCSVILTNRPPFPRRKCRMYDEDLISFFKRKTTQAITCFPKQ